MSYYVSGLLNAIVIASVQVVIGSVPVPEFTGVGRTTYPGVQPEVIWVGWALMSLLLGWNFAVAAAGRGHSRTWSLFAVLGPIGVAVVYGLPDRTRGGRGFPIEPFAPTSVPAAAGSPREVVPCSPAPTVPTVDHGGGE